MAKIEEQLKELNGVLEGVTDKIKGYAEKAEKSEQMGAEMKASIDKLLAEQAALTESVKQAENVVAELEAGAHLGSKSMTLGEWFAQQEAVKAYSGGKIMLHAAAVSDAVTSNTGDGKFTPTEQRTEIIGRPQRRLTVRDLLSWGTTESDAVSYPREVSFTNSAATVAENPISGKPQSKLEFEMVTSPVATIAHWMPASKQVLADMGKLQAYIDGRLTYGLDLAEEAQLLKGSGLGTDLTGLFTAAAAYAQPVGANVSGATAIDYLRLAILQAQLTDYTADGIVLSPTAWANIELTKDKNNSYLFAQPQSQTVRTLWGLPVVESNSMEADEFLVGSFAQAAMGLDREQTSVGIAEQHADFYVRNMVAILAEKRIALELYRPDALVKGSVSSGVITS